MNSHPVDLHVGKRLRSRRIMLGKSQEELGESVGITFQQIQKYERGLNRIGSSRLYDFSQVLGVKISFFFEDFNDPEDTNGVDGALINEDFTNDNQYNKEVLLLVRSFYSIPDLSIRKKLFALIRSLSSYDVKGIDLL